MVWGIWVVVKIMAPFLGTLKIRCGIIIRTPKGTIILTTMATTHIVSNVLRVPSMRCPQSEKNLIREPLGSKYRGLNRCLYYFGGFPITANYSIMGPQTL